MTFWWVLGSGVVFFTIGWFTRAFFYPAVSEEDRKHLHELTEKLKKIDPVQ